MPLPRYSDAIKDPYFANASVEEKLALNDKYWNAYQRENPGDKWGESQAQASRRALESTAALASADPLSKRALEFQRDQAETQLVVNNMDADGGWQSPQQREQMIGQRQAELEAKRQQLDKTFSLFKPEVAKEMEPTWKALDRYASDSGYFGGEGGLKGAATFAGDVATFGAFSEKAAEDKIQYEKLRDTVANDFNLAPEEVDDVMRHRLNKYEGEVSRDAFGTLHFKDSALVKNTDEIEAIVANSNLPESVKAKAKEEAPQRVALFKENVVQTAKQNFPELAEELGLGDDINENYRKIVDATNKSRTAQAASGAGAYALGRGETVMKASSGMAGLAPGFGGATFTPPPNLTPEQRAEFEQSIATPRKISEGIAALSDMIQQDKVRIFGTDAATVGQGGASVLESVALAATTGGFGNLIKAERIARAGAAGKLILGGVKAGLAVAPTAAIYGGEQALDTYERAIQSDDPAIRARAGELAFKSFASEFGVTAGMSMIGLGGAEKIGAALASKATRQAFAKSVSGVVGKAALNFGVAPVSEAFEESLITALDAIHVQQQLNPQMTDEQVRNSIKDTIVSTLIATGGISGPKGTIDLIGDIKNLSTNDKTTEELHDAADAIYTDLATQENLPETETAGRAFPTSGPVSLAEIERERRVQIDQAENDEERQALSEATPEELAGEWGVDLKLISNRGLEIAASKRRSDLLRKKEGREPMPGEARSFADAPQELTEQEQAELDFLEANAGENMDHRAVADRYGFDLKPVKSGAAKVEATKPPVAETPVTPAAENATVPTATLPKEQAPKAVAPADQPSPNLIPRATENAPPMPVRKEGQSREDFVAERDKWDDQYGKDHNPDGSPIQPTVLDETVQKAFKALSGGSFDTSLDATGGDIGAETRGNLEKLLNDGWVWDDTQNKMVDPQNRGETPLLAIARIKKARDKGNTPTTTPTTTPAPKPAVAPAPEPVAAPAEGDRLQRIQNIKTGNTQSAFALAAIAKQEGVDLTTMSREEYVEYAKQQGIRLSDQTLREQPSLRSATSMDEILQARKALNPQTAEDIKADQDFAVFAESVKQLAEGKGTQHNGEIVPGVAVRSGTKNSSSWLFFGIGKGAGTDSKGDTHKSYIGFKNHYRSLTPARFTAFMSALKDAGFNGDVKSMQDLASQRALSDQIVMHGNTKADADLALQIAESFFGSELSFKDTGIDNKQGGSHSQILANRLSAELDAELNVPTTPTAEAAVPTEPLPEGQAPPAEEAGGVVPERRVIKLGSVDPKYRAAAEDMREQLGEPVGFDDGDRRIVTPDGVQLEISSFGNSVRLDSIVTPSDSRKQGLATKAMNDFVKLADENGVVVNIIPKAFGREGEKLNDEQLVSWYEKFGFTLDPNGETMSRQPQPTTPTTNETEIQETSRPAPEQQQPTQPAAEGQAQERAAQREGEGQEVKRSFSRNQRVNITLDNGDVVQGTVRGLGPAGTFEVSSPGIGLMNKRADELAPVEGTKPETPKETQPKPIKLSGFKGSTQSTNRDLIIESLGEPTETGVVETDSGVKVEMYPFEDGVELRAVQNLGGTKGAASETLDRITEEADALGTKLYLYPKPFGTGERLSKAQLVAWYERKGFVMSKDGETMVRTPKETQPTQQPKAEEVATDKKEDKPDLRNAPIEEIAQAAIENPNAENAALLVFAAAGTRPASLPGQKSAAPTLGKDTLEQLPETHTPQPQSEIPAKQGTDKAPASDLSYRKLKSNETAFTKIVKRLMSHHVFRVGNLDNLSIEEIGKKILKQMTDNILFVYDSVPENIRTESKKWYKGANKIANMWSEQYAVSTESVAGVIAALSPQKDWFQNVSLAERVLDIWTGKNRKTDVFGPEMEAAAAKMDAAQAKEAKGKKYIIVEGERTELFEHAQRLKELMGRNFDDLGILDKAFFIRLYDETYNSRSYAMITPDGRFGKDHINKDGSPTKIAWGTVHMTASAVSMLENPSLDNISKELGHAHKIRSFYNNIINPDSDMTVTSDTHAVAVAYMMPLSGAAKEVTDNFGGITTDGYRGTYAFITEAYRQAAKKRGVKPSEMQSVTWEAIRDIFPAAFKRNTGKVDQLREMWNDFSRGRTKESYEKIRQRAYEAGGGYSFPSWYQQPEFGFGDSGTSWDRASTYAVEDSGNQPDGLRAGTGRGNGRGGKGTGARTQAGRADSGEQGTLFQDAEVGVDDQAHLAAVEAGDMETAQRMVDAAAKKAGYVEEVYHGTVKSFTKFREKLSGIWTAFDPSAAEPGSGDKSSVKMNLFADPGDKSITMSKEDLKAWRFSTSPLKWMQQYLARQYSQGTPGRVTSVRVGKYALVVTSASQLKSADPVTRDESGNVIPLSQRFNPASNSILFQDTEGPKGTYTPKAVAAAQNVSNTVLGLIEGKADTTTGIHEAGHAIEDFLREIGEGDKADALEAWANENVGDDWRKKREYIARGFERFVINGVKTGVESVDRAFARIAEIMLNIYKGIKGSSVDIDIPPHIEKIFNDLLSRGAKLEAEGKAPVTLPVDIKRQAPKAQAKPVRKIPARKIPAPLPFGVKREDLDSARRRYGIPEQPGMVVRMTDEEAFDEAYAMMAKHDKGEDVLVGQQLVLNLMGDKRGTNKVEVALLAIHGFEIQKALKDLDNKIAKLDPGETQKRKAFETLQESLLADFQDLVNITQLQGSKAGLALQAMKLVADQVYSVDAMLRRRAVWKNAGNKGASKPLTAAEARDTEKQSEKILKLIEERERLMKELEDKYTLAEAAAILDKKFKDVAKEKKPAKPRGVLVEKATAVATSARDRLRAMGLGVTRLSQLPETDQAHLAAVESGDMETAQRMVDEAAKAAGYTIKAYHGTEAKDFDIFVEEENRPGMFFASLISDASNYGSNIITVYLKLGNSFKTTEAEIDSGGMVAGGAKGAGYNSIIIRYGEGDINYAVFDPNQIKSADPVTRYPKGHPKAGQPIPLSERFDSEKDSILYQNSEPEENPQVEILDAISDVGVEYLANGAKKLDAFTEKLVAEFGEEFRSEAPTVFSLAKDKLAKLASSARQKTPQELASLIDPTKDISERMVYNMALGFMRQGLKGEAVLDAVTKLLQNDYPNITREEVVVAFTGYGRIKVPSQEQIRKDLRELRTIERLDAQLADLARGQLPKRTGLQRDKTTPTVRSKMKQVEQAIRDSGLQHNDKKDRLAGALDPIRTRLKNEIADMDQAIKTKTALNKAKKEPKTDAEIEKLKKERDEMKKRYDATFGIDRKKISVEAQIKRASSMLDRQIKALEAEARGEILSKTKKVKLDSPELKAKRERLETLREAKRAADEALNPKKTAAQVATERLKASAQKSIERFEYFIKNGTYPPKADGTPATIDDMMKDLLATRDRLRDTVREIKKDQRILTPPEVIARNRAVRQLNKTIADLEGRIARRDFSKRAKKPESTDPEVRRLKDTVASLRETLDQIEKDSLKPIDPEEKRIQRMISASKKRRENYEKRLAAGDFAKTVKRDTKEDSRLTAVKIEELKAKAAWMEEARKYALENMTATQRFWHRVKSAAIIRKIVTLGAEYGIAFRQLLFFTYRFWINPKVVTRTFIKAFSAGFSRDKEIEYYNEIIDRPNSVYDKRMKMPFISPFADIERMQELDAVDPDVLEKLNAKIPKWIPLRWATEFMLSVERFNRVSTNVTRAYMADNLINKGVRDPGNPTKDELAVIGNAVLAATGRGSLGDGKLDAGLALLNTVTISARYAVSRAQMTALQPLWTTAGKWEGTGKIRAHIAADIYGKTLVGRVLVGHIIAGIVQAALPDEEEEDIEWNPTSGRFGVISYKGTIIELNGGARPYINLLAQGIMGYKLNSKGERVPLRGEGSIGFGKRSWRDELYNFVRNRENINMAMIIDTIEQQHFGDIPMTKTSFTRQLLEPIIVEDMVNIFETHGIRDGAVLATAMFFGVGVRTPWEKTEKKEPEYNWIRF